MTPRQLELRDEIMQVLFWLMGEKLGDEASPGELSVWIAAEASELEPVLEAMVLDGFLKQGRKEESYCLSELGLREGGRRFVENFADAGLGSQGHGACSDDCDCHLHGPENCPEHGPEHGPDHAHQQAP